MAKETIASIILAAGKGTRINSQGMNKVAYPFSGEPMIVYGVKLFKKISERVIVVVGAFAETVKTALKDYQDVIFAEQVEQLGTGHAVKMGLAPLAKSPPVLVLVGMGDHMMYYKEETIKNLIEGHKVRGAVVSLITTEVENPTGYGRVEREKKEGHVRDIVEEKDASDTQRKIKEINAGLYCFDYEFLKTHINSLQPSAVTGEYYITDIIQIAFDEKKRVFGLKVPFQEVGIGVNRQEELDESQKYFESLH